MEHAGKVESSPSVDTVQLLVEEVVDRNDGEVADVMTDAELADARSE